MNLLQKIFDREFIAKNVAECNYQAREHIYQLIHPDMPDPVFIIGCSRAGTTVTFETIRSSTDLNSFPYEIPQFWHSLVGPWDDNWHSEAATHNDAQPEHRDKALAYFYARLGKGLMLDKSCINVMRISYLHSLFPNAYGVCLMSHTVILIAQRKVIAIVQKHFET
jgi:hypothetical protein